MILDALQIAHGDDPRCPTCGCEAALSRYYDTRGQRYCAPECWEEAEDARRATETFARVQ